jgi:hypothetical protein
MATKYIVGLVLATWLIATTSLADPKEDFLTHVLKTSAQPHLRASAALALGDVEPTPDSAKALVNALYDISPGVRTASARTLKSKAATGLYYLNVQAPTSLVNLFGAKVSFGKVRSDLVLGIDQVPGALFERPLDSAIPCLSDLPRYNLTASVTQLEILRGNSVSAQVVISVSNLKGEVRALLSGGVTVTGGKDEERVEKAIREATLVAVRRLDPAMKSLVSN